MLSNQPKVKIEIKYEIIISVDNVYFELKRMSRVAIDSLK